MRRSTAMRFNPRSREGSDGVMRMDKSVLSVSIHAPAKGATGDTRPCCKDCKVSIHAPAKGATHTRGCTY